MKAYLISDNVDSYVGLKISGIKGCIVHSREEALQQVNMLREDKEIGIIILTENAAKFIPDKVKELKLCRKLPLVVEIPDRHGSAKGDNSIIRYVKESIGIKI